MFTPRREQPETAQRPETAQLAGTGKGFMTELDEWFDFVIFEPIENAINSNDTKELHIAFTECKQLLKRKVLASYHNGLKAKQTSNPQNYGPQTRRRN